MIKMVCRLKQEAFCETCRCLFEIWHTVKAKGAAGLVILGYRMPDLRGLFEGFDVSKAEVRLLFEILQAWEASTL